MPAPQTLNRRRAASQRSNLVGAGVSPSGEIPVGQRKLQHPWIQLCAAGTLIAFPRGRVLMLMIQREGNGVVVLTLSGRLEADNVGELTALLAAEPAGRAVVLDLKNVLLVDRFMVRFLRDCEGKGITLRNCPPYIRAWIARETEGP